MSLFDGVFDERRCRGCGCTDNYACSPPCRWVEEGWCSACEHRVARRLMWLSIALAAGSVVGLIVATSLWTAGNQGSAAGVGILTGVGLFESLVIGVAARRVLERVAP